MPSSLVFGSASPFTNDAEVATIPLYPLIEREDCDRYQAPVPTAAGASIFALHLVNGEHYSGAERVQDLLARQLPQFRCEVGFACVKPHRFPNARETKTAPLVEMPNATSPACPSASICRANTCL